MTSDPQLQLIVWLGARIVAIQERFRELKHAPATSRNQENMRQLISDATALERNLRELADEMERVQILH